MDISPIALTAGYLSLIAGICGILLIIGILKKYIERKKKPTLLLLLSIMSYMITCFAASVIYFQAGTNLELAIIAQKIVYAGVFFGVMFMFFFASMVFFKPNKIFITIYSITGFILILVLFLTDSVVITEFPDDSGYPLLNINLTFVIITVVYIFPTVLSVLVVTIRTAWRIEEKEYRIGFWIIALGQIGMILVFVMDVLQGASTGNLELYALFLNLTWILTFASMVCYYLGWIMPKWFIGLFHRE